jgi:hypothetical protein
MEQNGFRNARRTAKESSPRQAIRRIVWAETRKAKQRRELPMAWRSKIRIELTPGILPEYGI